jgi:hypothetical protein
VSEITGPFGIWYADFSVGTLPDTTFTTVNVTEGESTPQLVDAWEPEIASANYCVSYTALDAGYLISARVITIATGETVTVVPIKTGTIAGTDSAVVTVSESQRFTLFAHAIDVSLTVEPDATIWITKGASG